MNETTSWDDIRLFTEIARAGGLAAASRRCGLSAPTLGRRMSRLEQTLARTLFIRNRDGYELTEAGEELFSLAEKVEIPALAIERWRADAETKPVVTIAAGPWTAVFLGASVKCLLAEDNYSIDIVSGITPVDLLRRHAQIGIRNRQPEDRGLAGRKLVRVEFAIYAHHDFEVLPSHRAEAADIQGNNWLELASNGATPPSAMWLQRKLGMRAPVRLPTTHSMLEAARAGAGLCVLPCFIGDQHATLKRASLPIRELAHDQWLVVHDDDRHLPPVRSVIDKVVELMRDQRALFAGAGQRLPAEPRVTG